MGVVLKAIYCKSFIKPTNSRQRSRDPGLNGFGRKRGAGVRIVVTLLPRLPASQCHAHVTHRLRSDGSAEFSAPPVSQGCLSKVHLSLLYIKLSFITAASLQGLIFTTSAIECVWGGAMAVLPLQLSPFTVLLKS